MSTAQDTAIYEDVASTWWDGSVRWVRTLANMVPARLRSFDQIIPDWRGLDVLDVGCAGGFLAEALAERGAQVAGIDPAAGALEGARAHATGSGLKIDYRVGMGEDLPWPDESFDVVSCVDVLEHVRDVDKVLAEAARVLRPGGWLLFDTINRNPLSSFVVVTMAERILGLLPRGAHDPRLFIRPDELRAKLGASGLEPGAFHGLGPTGMTRRGDLTFGPVPTTAIIYVGAACKARRRDPSSTEHNQERAMSKRYDVDTRVEWNWGGGTGEGTVQEVFTEKVTRTIKGNEVTRNASEDDPAYLIKQDDGDRVLKGHSELKKAG